MGGRSLQVVTTRSKPLQEDDPGQRPDYRPHHCLGKGNRLRTGRTATRFERQASARGVERVDDRRVISGIVHVLRSGCRWCDCPPEYGPPTKIYNCFVRWVRRGVWENLFRDLAVSGRSTDTQMIASTHVKAHRSAAGGKGGSRSRLLAARAEGAIRRFTHSTLRSQVDRGASGSSPPQLPRRALALIERLTSSPHEQTLSMRVAKSSQNENRARTRLRDVPLLIPGEQYQR